MKKLGMMNMLMAFMNVCMMEMHGFKYAVPALIFGGLAVIAVNIEDKPYKAKKRACRRGKTMWEDMAA